MDYTEKHAKLIEKARDRGAEVTFSSGSASVYDPATDTWSGESTVEVEGHAIEIPGDAETYLAMSLTITEPVMLFFVPNTFGELPGQNSKITWAGEQRAVKALFPIRPSGVALAARVVLV